jgi:hypothetical protein
MAFTVQEKERIRYHLGYLAVQPAASIQFGIPRPIQTLFLVETAMQNILPEAEDRVRRTLGIMDDIELKLVDAQDRLVARRLNGLELRDGEPDLLEKEYARWGARLADILGVPFYPFATRFRAAGGVVAGSIPVRSG